MCREIVVCFKQTHPFRNFPRLDCWWTRFVNHTRLQDPLQTVRLNFCASREPESPQNVPSPVGHDVSFDHPSTKMSISAAKILSTLPKSNLYLQHETKIMKSGEKRADDQNSGTISTDCSTTRSHRI